MSPDPISPGPIPADRTIRVEGLSKAYRIYPTPTDRLRQAIVPRLRRLFAPLLRLLGRPAEGRPYFNEFWALRELSFEVARGETVGIIGRNGSGKSTLLQLVCGTLTPTHGEVEVTGRIAALLELGSGFNPEYTGRQNVFLNAGVLGLSQEEITARLPDILAFADIGDFVDQPLKIYSSGMSMRLAFAVIAHVDADVLVVDEALAVGDSAFQQKCFRWLREFQKGGTVLFCAHDTSAVMSFCERAIWIDRGVVRLQGSAKEVCEGYRSFTEALTQGLDPSAARPASAAPKRASTGLRPLREMPPPPENAGPSIFDGLAESASFGSGDIEIVAVNLTLPDGSTPTWISGGEELVVSAELAVRRDVESPILGFHAKDRLGQAIFGDNTVTSGAEVPPVLRAGETVDCRFTFRLPLLASGRYSLTFAVASGTLETHVQHHWVHDALFFDVHSPYRNGVLVAVDIHEVSVRATAKH